LIVEICVQREVGQGTSEVSDLSVKYAPSVPDTAKKPCISCSKKDVIAKPEQAPTAVADRDLLLLAKHVLSPAFAHLVILSAASLELTAHDTSLPPQQSCFKSCTANFLSWLSPVARTMISEQVEADALKAAISPALAIQPDVAWKLLGSWHGFTM
jgi:hypothetical protein